MDKSTRRTINNFNRSFFFKGFKKLGRNGRNNDTMKYVKKYLSKLLTINLDNDKVFKKEF